MKNKLIQLFKRILRYYGFIKPDKYPIFLTENEKKMIRVCKNEYDESYGAIGKESVKILTYIYQDLFGFNGRENCLLDITRLFNFLLDIYTKIRIVENDENKDLKELFYASMELEEYKLPMERAIQNLYEKIRDTRAIENGVQRFCLD